MVDCDVSHPDMQPQLHLLSPAHVADVRIDARVVGEWSNHVASFSRMLFHMTSCIPGFRSFRVLGTLGSKYERSEKMFTKTSVDGENKHQP